MLLLEKNRVTQELPQMLFEEMLQEMKTTCGDFRAENEGSWHLQPMKAAICLKEI